MQLLVPGTVVKWGVFFFQITARIPSSTRKNIGLTSTDSISMIYVGQRMVPRSHLSLVDKSPMASSKVIFINL